MFSEATVEITISRIKKKKEKTVVKNVNIVQKNVGVYSMNIWLRIY